MVKHTKRRSRGGAYISKGTYGCAFARPPLKCKGEPSRRNDKQLSKVLDKEHADSEYAESEPFKRIDPHKKYFVWSHHKCALDYKNIKPENRMEKCLEPVDMGDGTYHQTIHPYQGQPTLLFYEFGGKDLSKLQLHSSEYSSFFKGLLNLLEGLVLLHSNGIVHNDIKPANIVGKKMHDGSFSLRFIDFGLSKSTSAIDRSSTDIKLVSNHWYWYYPFDFRFLWTGKSKEVKQKEVDDWYLQNQALQYFLPQFAYWDTKWNALYDANLLQKLINSFSYTHNIRTILEKGDVYALGISFGELYTRLTGHYVVGTVKDHKIVIDLNGSYVPVQTLTGAHFNGKENIAMWHKKLASTISIPFYALIFQMTYVDPMYRKNAADSIKYFNQRIYPNLDSVFNNPFVEKALAAIGISSLKTPGVPTPPPAVHEVISQAVGINEPHRPSNATNSTIGSEPKAPAFFNSIPTANFSDPSYNQPGVRALQPLRPGKRFGVIKGNHAKVKNVVPGPVVQPVVQPIVRSSNHTHHSKVKNLFPKLQENYFAAPHPSEQQNIPILPKNKKTNTKVKGFLKRFFGKTRKQRR